MCLPASVSACPPPTPPPTSACLEDKRRFCPDVEPGDARVKDCLEDHLKEPDFSPTW